MEIHALTSYHPLADGEAHLLGAVETVTGAMTLLETGAGRLLVDCGMPQGPDSAEFRFPEDAKSADAVLLTHGHFDHVGSLPLLFESGFDGPLFATRTTLDIADLVVTDSMRIHGATDGEMARFRQTLRTRARAVPYDRPIALPGFEGTVAFREAGHILGSASIEIVTPRTRVICSGDLGRPNSPILRDYCSTWSRGRPVDLVILESTYGDREHAHAHGDIESHLERIVLRTVRRGGHLLVPAFAIGRTQTLLYYLNELIESGRIPRLPVALDTPMGLKVTELYEHARALFDREALGRIARGDDPLDFDNLFAVKHARDSARLCEIREPMLIIAGSGMCTGGRVVAHLKELLPRKESCVLFVGFQAPGTAGAAIQRAARGHRVVQLDGDDIPVRASIETLSGLSAHADRRELLRWLHAIPDVKRVGLHHGEPEAQRRFARAVTAMSIDCRERAATSG